MDPTTENTLSDASSSNYTIFTTRTRGRQQFSLGVTLADEDGVTDLLEELLHQTWTIFGVSTFFDFHQDEIHLKQYAKRLREEVAISLEQENVTYSTTFLLMEDVTARPSVMDPPPIKIQVYAKNNRNADSIEKCIYKGIFISWRTTEDKLTTANSLRLPLLLCRGTKSTIRTVHYAFTRMFDCMIIALPVKEDDLIWFVPILITPTNLEEKPKSSDEVRMVYTVPGLPNTETITVKFQILDLLKLLLVIIKDLINDGNVDISFNLTHIEKFRDVLHTQMLQTSGIQLGLCTLHKIHLPAFTIMENRMKVMDRDTMYRILLFLNEKALEMFHPLCLET